MLTQQVQEFLESRRHTYLNPEAYRQARQMLLECDPAAVQAEFLSRFQSQHVEERARVMEGLALLYKTEATELILRGLQDKSNLVRWVTCGCLHDYGDARAQPGLLERLQQDAHPHVRGVAASALGRLGTPEVLPVLYAVWQSDHKADSQGHTPASQSESAITEILWRWVVRQMPATPPFRFEEQAGQGQLQGQVTAEAIPFDEQGRIIHTTRYAHLPISAFGNGCSTKLDLQTAAVAPFEVAVEYAHPTCTLQRLFVFCHHPHDDDINWSIHTILDASAMGGRVWTAGKTRNLDSP